MKNFKRIITVVSLALVMIVSAVVVSYSLKNAKQDIDVDEEIQVAAGATSGFKTNIDKIIEASYENGEDSYFDILMIKPNSGNASSSTYLKNLVEGNAETFKSYVFDRNKVTTDKDMKSKKIRIKTVSVAGLNAMTQEDISNLVNGSDLVYLALEKWDDYKAGTQNDFSDETYTVLRQYNDERKPIIIDDPDALEIKGDITDGGDTKTYPNAMGALIKKVFAFDDPDGGRDVMARTFQYDSNLGSLEAFFTQSGGIYNVMDSNLIRGVNQDHTNEYYANIKTAYAKYTGNVLVMTDADSPDTTFLSQINSADVDEDGLNTLLLSMYQESMLQLPDAFTVESKTFNSIVNDVAGNAAFQVMSSDEQVNYIIENYFMTDVTVEGTSMKAYKYDTLFIEKGDYEDLTEPFYNTLDKLSSLGMTIIVSDQIKEPATGGPGGGGTINGGQTGTVTSTIPTEVADQSNYQKFLLQCATSMCVPKSDNVLVSKFDMFKDFTKLKGLYIANIINGASTDNASKDKYKVLELQPCYPVDEALAKTQTKQNNPTPAAWGKTGAYYLKAGDLMGDVTVEEIAKGTEYYKFDISKAEIAQATGIPYSKIEIDHMSTETFKGTREDIFEEYDLIYIGANNNAIGTDPSRMYSKGVGVDWDANVYKNYNYYTTYYHNGWVMYLGDNVKLGDRYLGGYNKHSIATVVKNNQFMKTIARQTGNDLTVGGLERLKEYVNSGMPVIVSKQLADKYDVASTQKNAQHDIDPDSNMMNYLTYLKTNQNGLNVLWGLDHTQTRSISNTSFEYGETNTSAVGPKTDKTVTVFKTDQADAIAALVTKAGQRDVLVMDKMPYKYKEGNTSTYYVNDGSLEFEYKYHLEGFLNSKMKASDYIVSLIIDSDKNSIFDESPVDSANGLTGELHFTVPGDFSGPIHWKVVAQSGDNQIYYTGITKVVMDNLEKEEINVLQVNSCYGSKFIWDSLDSIFFDVDSQRAGHVLKYNCFNNNSNSDYGNFDEEKWLGRHEFNFGLVKYDAQKQDDSWYTNWAEALNDDYDVKLDIVAVNNNNYKDYDGQTLQNITQWVADAEKVTDAQKQTYKLQYQTYLGQYNTYKTQQLAVNAKMNALLDPYITGLSNGTMTVDKFCSDWNFNKINGWTSKDYVRFLKYMEDYNAYYYVHSQYYNQWKYYVPANSNADKYCKIFKDEWVPLQNKKMEAFDNYRKYERLSYGKDFLKEMYTCIVIGGSENLGGGLFDFDDKTCEYLQDFLDNGGNLFFFHETMTNLTDGGSQNLMKSFAQEFGLNETGVDIKLNAQGTSQGYVSVQAGKPILDVIGGTDYAKNLTKLLPTPTNPNTNYNFLTPSYGGSNEYYLSGYQLALIGFFVNNTSATYDGLAYHIPYIYANADYNRIAEWSSNPKEIRNAGTYAANQVNTGLVTEYPFHIGEKLDISGTHGQSLALDVEDENVVCWYALAGSNNKAAIGDIYAASPTDAEDSYFIYSKGGITYCGAGHRKVTGPGVNNNDERRLFINVIINSAKKSAANPVVKVYEPNGNFNKELKPETDDKGNKIKNSYILEIEDSIGGGDVYPEFDFTVRASSDISTVQVYWDTDMVENGSNWLASYNPEKDKMIWQSADLSGKNLNQQIRSTIGNALKFADKYSAPYNGEYAYIVISVMDSKGKMTNVRIKIKITKQLFEITENTIPTTVDAILSDKYNF